ncbi:hypothetical protein GCM10009554_50620 [Kribbella koreensis]|uniref:HTH cro/C1-type domain-containing protein n=1 Tax=Kribbella koreensis TaxID=57909 RepID=A0ABP4BIH2_9ACTN
MTAVTSTPSNEPRSLGTFIRSRRKQLGWTQTQLGDAVQADQTTVSTWERNESFPSDLHGLAKALGTSIEELADQAFGLLTDVERAIAHDRLLTKEKQDVLLAVYGVLTGRSSLQNGSMLRAEPRS